MPILISCAIFSMLAMAHKIFLPGKYSAFMQYKEEENVRKTIQSTSIRIIYLMVGTLCLNNILGFSEKQIGIGIFIACFFKYLASNNTESVIKIKKKSN